VKRFECFVNSALGHQIFESDSPRNSSFQARAAELDQHVDASARVPTYFELMCPVALQNCKRGHSTSVTSSVSIEMLARNAQQHPYALTMDQLPPAVHASGYIEADFEGPWGSSSPKQRLKVVWRRFIPVYIIVFGVYFATAYVFFKYASPCRPISPTAHLSSRYVVYDNEGRVKPMKGSCFNLADMQENICVFAAGQGAYGLIAVGQAAVGLVVLAQGGVGTYRQSVALLYHTFTPLSSRPSSPSRHHTRRGPGRTFSRIFYRPSRVGLFY
jgi:hypothetical protein